MRTVIAMVIAVALGSASPAFSQDRPADADALYSAAVQARLAGRWAEAIDGSRRVLALRPADVDARLNLALALMADGRSDDARRELDLVLLVAPAYEDARAARRRLDAAEASRQWRFDVSAARSRLSNDQPSWSETSATLTRVSTTSSVALTVEWAERFGIEDTYFEGRLEHRIGAGSAYVAIGGTPEATYRPEAAIRAGLVAPIQGTPLSGTLDASLSRYPVGIVSSLQPGVEYATADGRIVIGARWISVWDERDIYRSGYALRALLAVHDRVRLRAGWTDAPESSDGVTADVRATSLGSEFDLSSRFTLRLSTVLEERPAYDRREISLGLGYRF